MIKIYQITKQDGGQLVLNISETMHAAKHLTMDTTINSNVFVHKPKKKYIPIYFNELPIYERTALGEILVLCVFAETKLLLTVLTASSDIFHITNFFVYDIKLVF